jgi:hypothetical protein
MKGSSQHHASEVLFPGQNPFTHETEATYIPEFVWAVLRTRKRLTIPGFETCSTQSVANHYIDCAILVHAYPERDSINVISHIKFIRLNKSSWSQIDIRMILYFNQTTDIVHLGCRSNDVLG